MHCIYKLVALAFAASAVVAGAPADAPAAKRALLPALLGNIDLAISACPDVVL
ncbi:hypothetical protein LPJ61_006032, partial [Coemansia biformis]